MMKTNGPAGTRAALSVTANPDYRAKCLVCKVDDRPNFLAERIATFSARERAGMLQGFQLDPAPTLASQEDRIVQFYPLTMSLGNPTFNDYAYVDLLNADAVAAFLDSTHAVYARHLGDEFGKTIPALFTDEPCFRFPRYTFGEFGYRADDLAVPWTQDLPAYFQASNGYDLLPHLPSLFFDTGEYQGVRYDFYRTVTRMFTERYTVQLYHWCERHGLKLTGHFMGEDTLLWQIPWVGSVMPHLAWMHIPGVDKLGRNVNGFDSGMVLTMKQLDSVVGQTGKPRALCENYGCAGQDFAHTGRKWIGDWAYVLGVNLNNPHMALYSMRGERKRDCPQNLFFQQPWWPENRLIADYFARLSYALSQGERQVDILVIHPIRSAWAEYRPGASAPVIRLDQALNNLLLQLMQSQRDFHLGDEGLMERGRALRSPCGNRRGRPPVCGWPDGLPAGYRAALRHPVAEHRPSAGRVFCRRRHGVGAGAAADAHRWPSDSFRRSACRHDRRFKRNPGRCAGSASPVRRPGARTSEHLGAPPGSGRPPRVLPGQHRP